ncbi:MAG: redoxin domain-containing protein, partial [Planctomycetota bacterium]
MLSVRQFAQRRQEFFQRGVELVRIFHSPLEALRSYAEGEHAIELPVLADPEKQVYQAYGVHRGIRDVFAM